MALELPLKSKRIASLALVALCVALGGAEAAPSAAPEASLSAASISETRLDAALPVDVDGPATPSLEAGPSARLVTGARPTRPPSVELPASTTRPVEGRRRAARARPRMHVPRPDPEDAP